MKCITFVKARVCRRGSLVRRAASARLAGNVSHRLAGMTSLSHGRDRPAGCFRLLPRVRERGAWVSALGWFLSRHRCRANARLHAPLAGRLDRLRYAGVLGGAPSSNAARVLSSGPFAGSAVQTVPTTAWTPRFEAPGGIRSDRSFRLATRCGSAAPKPPGHAPVGMACSPGAWKDKAPSVLTRSKSTPTNCLTS